MRSDNTDVQPVPWRFKTKGSFYVWVDNGKQQASWHLNHAHFGEDAQRVLNLESFPKTVFRDEAHAQGACRRCAPCITDAGNHACVAGDLR